MSARNPKVNRAAILARMSLGVPAQDAGLSSDTSVEVVSEEADDAEVVQAEVGKTEETGTEAEVAATEAKEEVSDNSTLLSDYRTTLKENAKLEVKVETLTSQLEGLNTQVAAMEAQAQIAATALRTTCERLSLAVAGSEGSFESMSLKDLCDQFTTLNNKFTSTFKVSAVSRPLDANEVVTPVNNELKARIEAARKTTKRN